jgi:hypothetical protein
MSQTVDLSFPHSWRAEILSTRPLILPPRSFVYPRQAEEVERGALEVLVRPQKPGAPGLDSETRDSSAQEFLATCALGFRDPAVPTGLWSTPEPDNLCAVAGGYAYLIDTAAPEHFTMLPYRPVMEVRAVPAEGLLLFVGHRSILAWGRDGQAWESERLSDEGLTISSIENGTLRGVGWEMRSDKETSFTMDLRSGLRNTPENL